MANRGQEPQVMPPHPLERNSAHHASAGWVLVTALLAIPRPGATPCSHAWARNRGAQEPARESFSQQPGTVLYLRLETPVSTKESHLHGPVTARVVREGSGKQGGEIPLRAVVRGEIEKLIPSSNPADRARLRLRFTELDLPARPSIAMTGHLKGVDNAREKVLSDGTVQGLLATELPLARLEDAIRKLGKNGEDLQWVKEMLLGNADTSIELPLGTDLEWVLDQPLKLEDRFDPEVPDAPAEGTRSALERLLSRVPLRTSSKDGAPGDPINLILVGSSGDIRRAFQEAGWSEAGQKSAETLWETIRAVIADRGYSAAPVSDLYLYGRAEDMAFEKMLNTFTKRHHLRLWRSPALTPEGREIWMAAATHDIGLDVRPGVFSHAIDPEIDAERDKVRADLVVTGLVAATALLDPPSPLREGLTTAGAPWRTDGLLLALELRSQ